ncbi:sensor histidine kinase [Cryptosporangium phraense]|uniref:histidine kinase n=1 Tax=Cryptosporangium phraense TaxID=2593070 RepID=A0A545AP26_9ACTN|nr:HAMP domain-containing sensor histidine kinase [Cryptosporangium phraense]TQS43082.1 HAMP domain-containing histidine kinase [Cryptosporangium phraense]
MPDLVLIGLVALGCSLAVGLAGVVVLRSMRGRSVTAHLSALLVTTVVAIVAGVVVSARAMFISSHDMVILFVVIGVSGVVSLAVAWWAGRRLTRQSIWADEARAREREAESRRREIVAWVSHDLRTPLAGLRAMAEALEDGVVADPATVADYHRRIRRETYRMSELVDDLFELSRINAGALRLTLADVSLADVVSDAVATAAPLARAKGVRLVAEQARYATVRASEPELGRVFSNLLLNAIRHTPSDGVVTVTGDVDPDGGWVAVSDACGGIPEADLPRVFDEAFRGEAARTPGPARGGEARGGLGLAIARGLVEAHQGQIAVANIDAGCRFTVRLPVP